MQDKPLITLADVRTIAGNLSKNVDDEQMAPYILEAQTGEIREFLGDELYLALLNEFDEDETEASVVNLLRTDGNFTPGLGDTGIWLPGIGWEINISGFRNVETTSRNYEDAEVIEGSFTAVIENPNPVDVQLLDGTGLVVASDLAINVAADGKVPFSMVVPGGFVNPGRFRISANFAWGAGAIFMTQFQFDINDDHTARMFALMDGADYINSRGLQVRFNGLDEVLKYWAYYRFVTANDMQNLRFGNRLAADGIFSDAQTRVLVKGVVYRAKNQALKFQSDADKFINNFIVQFPEFRNNTRRKPSRSFEFNKLPQNE